MQTLITGKALGKAAEAQALVDKVNAKIDEAKKANPSFARKVLVEDYGPEKGQHWLVPAKDPRRALFDALGFTAQTESQDVSEERLDLLDRDVLFVNGATKADMLKSRYSAASRWSRKTARSTHRSKRRWRGRCPTAVRTPCCTP